MLPPKQLKRGMSQRGKSHRAHADQGGKYLWAAQLVADADQIGHAVVFEEHADFVAGIAANQIAPCEHAGHITLRIAFVEFEQANAAQSRLRAVGFESAGRCISQVAAMHVPDERVFMVMPAEQCKIAAGLAQGLHFADVVVRAADCFAET